MPALLLLSHSLTMLLACNNNPLVKDVGDYCLEKTSCEGGTEADSEECQDEVDAIRELVTECSDEEIELQECREEHSECVDGAFTYGDACDEEEQAFVDCGGYIEPDPDPEPGDYPLGPFDPRYLDPEILETATDWGAFGEPVVAVPFSDGVEVLSAQTGELLAADVVEGSGSAPYQAAMFHSETDKGYDGLGLIFPGGVPSISNWMPDQETWGRGLASQLRLTDIWSPDSGLWGVIAEGFLQAAGYLAEGDWEYGRYYALPEEADLMPVPVAEGDLVVSAISLIEGGPLLVLTQGGALFEGTPGVDSEAVELGDLGSMFSLGEVGGTRLRCAEAPGGGGFCGATTAAGFATFLWSDSTLTAVDMTPSDQPLLGADVEYDAADGSFVAGFIGGPFAQITRYPADDTASPRSVLHDLGELGCDEGHGIELESYNALLTAVLTCVGADEGLLARVSAETE